MTDHINVFCPVCHVVMDSEDISDERVLGAQIFSPGGTETTVRYINLYRLTCPKCKMVFRKHGPSVRPE